VRKTCISYSHKQRSKVKDDLEQKKGKLTSIRSKTVGLNMYIPALILFPTNSTGFSTNRSITVELGLVTTTPYADGSATFVTYHQSATHSRGRLRKNIP